MALAGEGLIQHLLVRGYFFFCAKPKMYVMILDRARPVPYTPLAQAARLSEDTLKCAVIKYSKF